MNRKENYWFPIVRGNQLYKTFLLLLLISSVWFFILPRLFFSQSNSDIFATLTIPLFIITFLTIFTSLIGERTQFFSFIISIFILLGITLFSLVLPITCIDSGKGCINDVLLLSFSFNLFYLMIVLTIGFSLQKTVMKKNVLYGIFASFMVFITFLFLFL